MYGLGWSFSRSEILLECDRKFFYTYGHGDEPFGPEAKRLKALVSSAMLAGSICDELIGHVIIRQIKGKESSQLSKAGLKVLEKFWNYSADNAKAHAAGDLLKPKYPILLHHYFGEEPDTGLEKCREKVVKCLDAFENSEVWQLIQSSDPKKFGRPRLIEEQGFPPSFSLTDDLDVYAAFDFYFEVDGNLHILDWKSGRASARTKNKALKQLGIYALYGVQVLGYPLEKVHVQPVWLDHEIAWQPQKVTQHDIENSKHSILCESQLIKDRIVDTGKTYLDKPIYELDIRNFPAKPSQMSCKNCNFSSICPDKFNGTQDPG